MGHLGKEWEKKPISKPILVMPWQCMATGHLQLCYDIPALHYKGEVYEVCMYLLMPWSPMDTGHHQLQ